jgi:hypothetical protein
VTVWPVNLHAFCILYLVATLYCNACEDCKKGFQRITLAGGPTSESTLAAGVAYGVLKRPQFFLPGFSIGPHGQPFAEPYPKVSTSPPAITVGEPALQVKLERVWMHQKPVTFVKFSPDGASLAVGLTDSEIESQKTYIYDVTNWKKIWSIRFNSDLCLLLTDVFAPVY